MSSFTHCRHKGYRYRYLWYSIPLSDCWFQYESVSLPPTPWLTVDVGLILEGPSTDQDMALHDGDLQKNDPKKNQASSSSR